jgi:hypothetical protein
MPDTRVTALSFRRLHLKGAEEKGMEPTAALQTGLEATGIPPERLGQARTARLSQPERRFYFWILRSFVAGTPPEGEPTRQAAARFGLDAEQALAVLAREDLVHADAGGRPLVAYPFSAEGRGHRVLIDEHWVEAMCAIDALGIAPMLELPIEIVSRDPLSGAEIWVRLDPGDGAWWEPEAAVVLAASTRCEGPSFRGCCDVLNFFEAKENAERYLSNHDEINGFPISIADAIELGRLVFGDLLTDS